MQWREYCLEFGSGLGPKNLEINLIFVGLFVWKEDFLICGGRFFPRIYPVRIYRCSFAFRIFPANVN